MLIELFAYFLLSWGFSLILFQVGEVYLSTLNAEVLSCSSQTPFSPLLEGKVERITRGLNEMMVQNIQP